MRPSQSFDSSFWVDAVAIAKSELERVEVVEQIKEFEFLMMGNDPEDWLQDRTREELELQRDFLKKKIDSFQKQVLRLESSTGTVLEQASQRSYVSCFLSSKLGASADISAGRRSSDRQTLFRKKVFNAYHAVPGSVNIELAWDVISGAVVRKDSLTASHFFAYRHGQDALIAIFGEDAKDDLWSEKNGLLLPVGIEDQLESGIFTIYPDFPDDATYEQRMAWHQSEPKEYRIRFLDKPEMPKNPKETVPLYHRVYQPNLFWKDLDGRRLRFQGDARPKARYIYFHFLLNMLRFAWRKKSTATTILQPELGMPYWGTPGAYVRQGQLQGFMNQLGHISGVETPTPTTAPPREDDDNVLAEALKSQVLDSSRKKCLSSQEYEDSDEEIEDDLE